MMIRRGILLFNELDEIKIAFSLMARGALGSQRKSDENVQGISRAKSVNEEFNLWNFTTHQIDE